MKEVLQFQCPACGTTLTVPAAAAGIQGPCPHCGELITAPAADPLEATPPPILPVPPPPEPPVKPIAPRPSPVSPSGFPAPVPAPIPPSETSESPLTKAYLSVGVSPRRDHGHRTVTLVLSCLLSVLIGFGAGFLWERLRVLEKPLVSPFAVEVPRMSVETAAAVQIPSLAVESPEPAAAEPDGESPRDQAPPAAAPTATALNEAADVPSATPEEAALKAFLTAPGWTSRSAHVLSADVVRQAMAEHAAQQGDGPIPYKEATLLQEADKTRVFLVRTATLPSGFPVVLSESESGGWLVDWEGFTEFHDDAFRHFTEQGPTGSQSFRLLVNPADAKPDADGVIKYRLNPPMPGRERVARVEDGSTAASQLREIFSAQAKQDPETYKELMASSGLPMIVRITKRPAPQGGVQLWIDRVLAAGWSPALPPQPDSP